MTVYDDPLDVGPDSVSAVGCPGMWMLERVTFPLPELFDVWYGYGYNCRMESAYSTGPLVLKPYQMLVDRKYILPAWCLI
ncbi:hypothetical protein F0562_009473 [Nyssa sinensis]|uniref:Uncharacterized protein n=1 Tax=Nyssa sinensis TaxID=561372 RepID=A0A5J4ZXL7_9ASTE|nr:hypothetical protein F0562_009473 [Nyssa sinensis]